MDTQPKTMANAECKPIVDHAIRTLKSFSEDEKRELLIFLSGVQYGRMYPEQRFPLFHTHDSA